MSRQVQGLRPWIWQRVSALYLAGFLIYFVISILYLGQFDFLEWRNWIAHPLNSILIYVGFLMLFVHAWVGIKDVVMDYIHPLALRSMALMLIGLGLLSCLVWLSRIMLLVLIK